MSPIKTEIQTLNNLFTHLSYTKFYLSLCIDWPIRRMLRAGRKLEAVAGGILLKRRS